MGREVEDYVKQCKSCQVNKILTPKNKSPMQVTTTAERPIEKCYLVVVGPLPVTVQGYKYILTFQDDLSKYVLAVPIEKQDAETVARAFVERIVLLYGTPQNVQKDQGSNFMSEIFRDTCSLLKIKNIQSTSFHPESQGCIERSHRVLPENLRQYVSDDQTDWDSWVPFATYAYNTTQHSAKTYTPFELLFGRPTTLPSALRKPPEPRYNYDYYASELKGRLRTVHQQAHKRLIERKEESSEYYDKTAGQSKLKAGDKVLLFDETVGCGRSRKLSAQWLVPYTIPEIHKVNATIARGRKLVKVKINRLEPFY